MADELVAELLRQEGGKLVVYHAVREEQTTADGPAGRVARQQALVEEVQHLRKVLQKYYALHRHLEAFCPRQGGMPSTETPAQKVDL